MAILFAFFFFQALSWPEKQARPVNLPERAPSEILEAQEASDRQYLPKVRELIALANQSLDVSLLRMGVSDRIEDPVRHLMTDLVTAAKRGVKVRLFLNTFSGTHYEDSLFLREDHLENLRRNGVEVHFVSPSYSLSDRLVIADMRWILEGGLAWTADDLEKGLASATVVDSSSLAQKKRIRLELLPLWDVKSLKEQRDSGVVSIPLSLLTEMNYFPAMTQYEDADAFRIYLALLRIFLRVRDLRFDAVFESLGQELPIDRTADNHGVMFQVRQTLERLNEKYGLLKIDKMEPDRATITLSIPGKSLPAVGVPVSFFDGNYVKELPVQALYAYFVILYRSQMSGDSPVWLGSAMNVENDFPISHDRFQLGVDELRRQNLIEIYPFRLNQSDRNPEARYLLNSLPSLSERLDTWSRLRDQLGDDTFKKARQMAEEFGEPEDPKVVVVFTGLLNRFPEEAVRALTQHVALVRGESTPALLDYLETILKYEAHPEYQVGTHIQ